MKTKTIYGYKNITTTAGYGVHQEIVISEIALVNCWFDMYGNPAYVFHMVNGDSYLLLDDYGAMDKVNHLSRVIVKRKKDLFLKSI